VRRDWEQGLFTGEVKRQLDSLFGVAAHFAGPPRNSKAFTPQRRELPRDGGFKDLAAGLAVAAVGRAARQGRRQQATLE
jgi:hypothetical protein